MRSAAAWATGEVNQTVVAGPLPAVGDGAGGRVGCGAGTVGDGRGTAGSVAVGRGGRAGFAGRSGVAVVCGTVLWGLATGGSVGCGAVVPGFAVCGLTVCGLVVCGSVVCGSAVRGTAVRGPAVAVCVRVPSDSGSGAAEDRGAVGVRVGCPGVAVGREVRVSVGEGRAVLDVCGSDVRDRDVSGVGRDRSDEAVGVGRGVPPSDEVSAQTPKPPATRTAAPPTIHGALRGGRR